MNTWGTLLKMRDSCINGVWQPAEVRFSSTRMDEGSESAASLFFPLAHSISPDTLLLHLAASTLSGIFCIYLQLTML